MTPAETTAPGAAPGSVPGAASASTRDGRGMVVACHQPDLLPYSGFWHKMAKSTVFDLKVYDQYLKSGYQRRVKMRGEWAGVPVMSCPVETRIIDVRIDPTEGPRALANTIHGRYGGSANYRTVGRELEDRIRSIHTDRLWELNLALILAVRDLLGIRTPVSVSGPPAGPKLIGLVDICRRYGADTYLSGAGAKAYMGDCREFTEAGIDVVYSRHHAATGDSILTVLMDCEDPMAVVLAEDDTEEGQA